MKLDRNFELKKKCLFRMKLYTDIAIYNFLHIINILNFVELTTRSQVTLVTLNPSQPEKCPREFYQLANDTKVKFSDTLLKGYYQKHPKIAKIMLNTPLPFYK
ncbi:hypothetical protein BpHYR1_003015 [Brachionus plicatilis]|uniref:Uncharacterized protein n=1 Tax=Brachionus plicatilis TaxID=10195 RepID=A0A3M7S4V2_BRAPC|nr:hypothetical protein BpHYR1_003015 [Brachionus plicatilis]